MTWRPKQTFGVIAPVSGIDVSGPDPILSRRPDSSAFRRIRLVPPVPADGDFADEVFGLGFGLGSTEEVEDLRLKEICCKLVRLGSLKMIFKNAVLLFDD